MSHRDIWWVENNYPCCLRSSGTLHAQATAEYQAFRWNAKAILFLNTTHEAFLQNAFKRTYAIE